MNHSITRRTLEALCAQLAQRDIPMDEPLRPAFNEYGASLLSGDDLVATVHYLQPQKQDNGNSDLQA